MVVDMISQQSSIHITPNLDFSFPIDLCCNCGRQEDLQIIDSDTRLTRYMFAGGSELMFHLPLPYCSDCTASARRRPQGIMAKCLMALMLFGALAVIGVVIAMEAGISLSPGSILVMSGVVAGAFMAFMIYKHRPHTAQTSYYQPVRIKRVKQTFVTGEIQRVVFGFTNSSYEAQFRLINDTALSQNYLGIAEI